MAKLQQGCTSAIIRNDKGQILFTKRADDEEFMSGYWELPGGGMDYGETPEECIKREIMEECGIEIEILKPASVNVYYMREVQRIEICFLCKPITQDIKLSHEHSDFRWLDISEVGSIKVSSYIKKVLKSASKNIEL